MNLARPILALIGLICIALFYIYRNTDFLGLGLIFFAVGLVLMGVFRRPKQAGKTVRKPVVKR
ncbi:MAG: hypothetical protein ACRECH_06970 [Nitrososphaerales archaeon]